MELNLWKKESGREGPMPVYPAGKGEPEAGICVVGGGLAGVLTAYLLQQGGAQVLLLEADRIASGASGANTGKVTCQHGAIYHTLLEKQGTQVACDYYQAARLGVELIGTLVGRHHISCGWMEQDDYLFTRDKEGERTLWKEWRAYQQLGIPGALVDSLPFSLGVEKALRMDKQHGYNPFAFTHGVATAFVELGGRIWEGCRVTGIQRGEPCRLQTTRGVVTASQVVVATGTPFLDGSGLFFSRLEPHRFYLMAWPAPKTGCGAAITIDREDSTPSVRYANAGGKRWLLVGGEEQVTGRGDGHPFDNLRVFAAKAMGLGEPVYHWAAQDNTTPDKMPYLGRVKGEGELWVIAGFNLWGNSWSAAGASILSQLILRGSHPLAETFAPYRAGAFLNGAFLKENLQVAGEYVSSKLTAAGWELPQRPGQARVVLVDGKRYGAYLDEKGKLYLVDITCPHMGCTLHWNRAEKSWDCPCHGSRFGYDGRLLEGPATADLSQKGQGSNPVDPHIFG